MKELNIKTKRESFRYVFAPLYFFSVNFYLGVGYMRKNFPSATQSTGASVNWNDFNFH